MSSGKHGYEVRGRILVSKSQRASCLLDFDAPPPGAIFRRGDADSSQAFDISDPILTLEFLFLGRGFLSCEDAADADDSGALDITDVIYSLEYQFVAYSTKRSMNV